jgi:hypothetical protein
MSSAIPLALPKSMLPTPEGATSAGITSQWVRVQPNNASSVVSSTLTPTASQINYITLGSQQLNFDLPTGTGANVWCDTAKSTISFRVRYELVSDMSGVQTAFLQSSAHSYINRMTTYVAGNVVDDVTGYDVAMCEQTNWGYDIAQRDALFNLGMRAEQDNENSLNILQGHSIPAFTPSPSGLSANSNYFSYEIPFHNSLFGTGNRSMCPIGRLAKSSISLYTPQNAPVIIASASLATAGSVRITIDQIAINLFTITLDEPSMRLLNTKSEMYMAGVTHRVGSGAIGASTTGSVSVQIPVRVKSARSLCTRFSENAISTAGSANGLFDSKMPLCSALNYFIGSQKRVPPVPHNTTVLPSTVYSRALMANFDNTYDAWKLKSGHLSGSYFSFVAGGSTTGYDKLVIDATSTTAAGSLASFSFCEDLRAASSANFLSGQDLTVSNSYLEANFANSNTSALNVTFIAKADIIFVVLPDGSVESRV